MDNYFHIKLTVPDFSFNIYFFSIFIAISCKFLYKYNPNESQRDLYVSMGRKLKDEEISYNFTYQIFYDADANITWLFPKDITFMRCDGVIEYTYYNSYST